MSSYKDYRYENNLPDHTQAYIFNPINKLLEGKKDLPILDLGCGNGYLVNKLISMGYLAYGTDASETGILQASKIYPDNFAIQDLSSNHLPQKLKDKKFKIIISTEVIEHLYDPRAFIKFAKQILLEAGGGEIILTTPYHGYLKNLVISVLGKWDTHANPLWEGGHIKLWSKKTLSKLLEEEGFKVENFIGCGRIPFLWKSMLIHAFIYF